MTNTLSCAVTGGGLTHVRQTTQHGHGRWTTSNKRHVFETTLIKHFKDYIYGFTYSNENILKCATAM